MILAVSLMGCSTLLGDTELWTAAAKEKEIAAVAPVVNDAKTPDIPPYVDRCIRYGLAQAKHKKQKQEKTKTEIAAKSPSADKLVLARLQTEDERRKCARAVLNWYRTLQEANKKAAKTS